MALQKFTNNATSQMSGSLTQGGTTLVLATGTGDRFPTVSGGDYFLITLYELDVSSVEQWIEVVKVTARTADTLTIVRDFESMTGQAGGYAYPSAPGKTVYVELRFTAAGAGEMLQAQGNLSELTSASTARTNLGVAIGTNVQAWDADLDWVAANITAAGKALLDDADAAAQRTTLGLGTAATQAISGTDITNWNTAYGWGNYATAIGVTIQGYDVDTTKNDVANTFTATQTIQGNLVLSGTSRLITGDFTNATVASRTFAQSSTANGMSSFGVIPNGTSTNAYLAAYNNSTPTNSAFVYLGVDNTRTMLVGAALGSGTALPLAIDVAGVERVRWGELAGAGKYHKAQRGTYTTLTDAATIAVDLATSNFFRCLLGGNRTLGEPTNGETAISPEGQSGTFTMYQDGTGSRTLAYAWCYDFASGTAPTLSTGKYAKDLLAYQVDYFRSSTVTITIASPGVVTWSSHGLLGGQKIQLTTTGALPTGLSASTTYYVIPVDANTFRLATSYANAQAGTAINTSGSQSGTHTMKAISITISAIGDAR